MSVLRRSIIIAGLYLIVMVSFAYAQSLPGGGGGGDDDGSPPSYFSLIVAKGGAGSGMVTGDAIDCGIYCSGEFIAGSSLVLTATPDAGSTFGGWSGDCAGSGASCSLTFDDNKSVTARFTVDSSGSGSGDGDDNDSGGGNDDFDDWSDEGGAYDFQEAVTKRPPKPKKAYRGVSAFDDGRKIKKISFTGTPFGANWRVGGSATDPVAQGTITGKKSLLRVLVGLYTGSVFAQFDGGLAHWIASFYTDDSLPVSEFFNGKIMYQEGIGIDDEGEERKVGLLLTGKTIFGTYEGGSLFIVDVNALPDTALASAIMPVPQGAPWAIPVDTILNLLKKAGVVARELIMPVARAARQAFTPAEVFKNLGIYKKIRADNDRIEQEFGAIDFESPSTDFEAVDALVETWQKNQDKLDSMAYRIGRARLFARRADWLSTGGSATYALLDRGVDLVPAALVGQLSGPFDFYTVQTISGKERLFAGTCTGAHNPATEEEVVCVLRKPTAAQSKAVLKAHGEYSDFASKAHDTLGDIELALFSSSK